MTLDELIAKYPWVRLLVDVDGLSALDGKMVGDAIEYARMATVRAEKAEARVAVLEAALREYVDADDFVYGEGHTERSKDTRRLLGATASVSEDPCEKCHGTGVVSHSDPEDDEECTHSRPSEPKREPVVWADEASPFTGPQVKDLLDENERLQRACSETAWSPEVVAVIEAAERFAEEVWSNNRTDEEQEEICRAVRALHDVETGSEGAGPGKVGP